MAFFALLVLITMFEKTFFEMLGKLFDIEEDDSEDIQEKVFEW